MNPCVGLRWPHSFKEHLPNGLLLYLSSIENEFIYEN